MSSQFLNCAVKAPDGTAHVGVRVSLTNLSSPNDCFEGLTDDSGEIWQWYRPFDDMLGAYWVPGLSGSVWRVVFDVYTHLPLEHPFPVTSFDFRLHGDTDRNLTLVIGAYVAIYNGPLPLVFRQTDLSLNPPSPPGSARIIGRRSSSSLGNLSDTSSVIMDDDRQPLLAADADDSGHSAAESSPGGKRKRGDKDDMDGPPACRQRFA